MPLNAIVLGVLLNHISLTALTCCSVMLALAFVCQRTLIAHGDGRDLLGHRAIESEDECGRVH